jgi:hypothetical protein
MLHHGNVNITIYRFLLDSPACFGECLPLSSISFQTIKNLNHFHSMKSQLNIAISFEKSMLQ